MLLLSDLVVFVEPSSNMNEFALIVMVVKDSLDGFGLPFIDESNQILLLILLLHLDMIVKLSEGSFKIFPVLHGVFMESFNNLFDRMSDIVNKSVESVIIGEIVC